MENLLFLILLTVCGITMHYLKQIIQAKKNGSKVNFLTYWTLNIEESLFAIISATAAFILFYMKDILDEYTAFGIGYMCNSLADILASRAKLLSGDKND